MASNPVDRRRQELEDEYLVWANICLDKHGLPYPIQREGLKEVSDSELSAEIKRLKVLGRTPHE